MEIQTLEKIFVEQGGNFICPIHVLKERISKTGGFLEYAQYTRPEIFKTKDGKKWKVPSVLLSGNHKDIDEWKKSHGKVIEK